MSEEEINQLISDTRSSIIEEGRSAGTPYSLILAAGAEQLGADPDTFQKCMARADKKLYADKRRIKGEER